MSEYWDRVNRRALSRRAVLKGGATGLLGLVAAGCAPTASPAPTTEPPTAAPAASPPAARATTAPATPATPAAKRGGTYTYYTSANEFAHLDPHQIGFIPFFDN